MLCVLLATSSYGEGEAGMGWLVYLAWLLAVTADYTALDPAFVKDPADSRAYLAITLGNGLQAVVVADPRAEGAFFALNVLSGDFHAPASSPGVASAMAQALAACTGGQVQSRASSESTMYQLRVNNGTLDPALKR